MFKFVLNVTPNTIEKVYLEGGWKMGIVAFIVVEVQDVLNFHFVVCLVSFSCHIASQEYQNP